jgi:hypothetical protein
MNLQKKLIQLSEYKCSFKYVESYFLVSVTYPENWSIIPSEDKSIEVAEEEGTTFYAAPIETEIEKAFSLIDDTISYNLDVEKKMALLKYNIGKLQELFAEKDLDELETIEFIFNSKKKKEVKKVVRKQNSKKKKPISSKDEKLSPLLMEEYQDNCEENQLELNISNEPIPTENKYLEEVDR